MYTTDLDLTILSLMESNGFHGQNISSEKFYLNVEQDFLNYIIREILFQFLKHFLHYNNCKKGCNYQFFCFNIFGECT